MLAANPTPAPFGFVQLEFGFLLGPPDGSYLVVHNLDLEGNRDATDLYTYTVSDRSWKRLTSTARASEVQFNFTKDARRMLVVTTTTASQIMSVPVAPLLASAPE